MHVEGNIILSGTIMENRYCVICGEVISKFYPDGRKMQPHRYNVKQTCCKEHGDALAAKKRRTRKAVPKICPSCGKEFVSSSNHYRRIYCSKECVIESKKTWARLKQEQVEYLIENFNFRGVGYCAKYFGLRKKTLQYKIRKYQKEFGPIPYKSVKLQPIETKPVDVKREYSEAWIECKWILDRWHNQIIKGRTDLMKIHKIMRRKQDTEDEEIIAGIYQKGSRGMINNILNGNYEKVS